MSAPSEKVPPITSAFDPDLGVVGRFIQEMLSRGAVVTLVAAIVALLGRMRDLNTELMKKLKQVAQAPAQRSDAAPADGAAACLHGCSQ